jgi:two-component system, NtrC family, sensor kinase
VTADDVAVQVNEARLASVNMLLAGLVHEINTPLGALHSNHDVLQRALQKLQDILADEVVEPHELDEVRRIVRTVDAILRVNDMAVERMVGLVRSLRSFGRLDRAEIDRVDLHEGLDSTLAILSHELAGVNVVREYGTLPAIECHGVQINQVFMNLVLNARQATPAGGTITIRTARRGDAAEISISDTGAGIRPEHLSRIFEPGFTTKAGRVSMGLGLAICRQIIDQHGGRIEAASQPGTGSEFTIRLPVKQLEDAAVPATSPRTTEESDDLPV